LLREDGRVKVITRTGEDGELRLAGNSLPKSDPKALTTLPVLYDLIQYLGWDFASAVRQRKVRPSVSELDKCYEKLADRMDQLLSACGNVSGALQRGAAARDLRSPKGKEGEGHPMMRPVVQKAVARVAKEICEQGHLQWNEVLKRLSKLDWRLAAAPWCAVYNGEAAKMMVGKENTELLAKLLHAHLAPASMQSIKGARREFKVIRGVNYPVTEEKLAKGLAGVAQGQRGVTPSAVAELSDRVEDELRHEDAELGRE
jgi:DNA sulfur modification protein DndB